MSTGPTMKQIQADSIRLELYTTLQAEITRANKATCDNIDLRNELAALRAAPLSARTAIDEAAYNLVQLWATSNSMLSRAHLIECAEKRLRELDPDNALVSHVEPQQRSGEDAAANPSPGVPAVGSAPPPSTEETCWLIERGQAEGQIPTMWFSGDSMHNQWSEDVTKAMRFPYQAAAEAEANRLFGRYHGDPRKNCHVAEHIFLNRAPIKATDGRAEVQPKEK